RRSPPRAREITDAACPHAGADPGVDRAESPRARDLAGEAADGGRAGHRLALTADPTPAPSDDRGRHCRLRAGRRDRGGERADVRPSPPVARSRPTPATA